MIINFSTNTTCFDWISEQTDRSQPLVKLDLSYTTKWQSYNAGTTYAPPAHLCSYETTSKKIKQVHANLLHYTTMQGESINTGICRAEGPFDIKNFFSWLIFKGQTEERPQHIFNLICSSDTPKTSLPYNFNEMYPGKKSRIEVKRTTTSIENDLSIGSLAIKKIYKAQKEPVTAHIALTHYNQWKDGSVVSIPVLDDLARQVNDAKKTENPIIHCIAGKGRTGTLTVASIVKETIQGDENKLGITKENYREVISHLIISLRNNGGGDYFVQTEEQLALLFEYALHLLTA